MNTEEYFDDEVNADNCGKGGFESAAPGRYHCEVVDYEYNDKQKHEFTLQIRAGNPAKKENGPQVGKQIKMWISSEHKDHWRKWRAQIALVLGLVTKEETEAARKAGKPVVIPWSDSVGRHCGVIATQEKYNGKINTRVAWPNEFFALNSKEAEGMPIDHAALRGGGGNPFGGPSSGGSVADSTASKAPASASSALFG